MIVAIPKRYKKQVKSAMSGKTTQTIQKESHRNSTKPKSKQTWALKIGDLVECDDGECAIIVDSRDGGYYNCLSTSGSRWRKATKLVIVQKGKKKKENPDDPKHAKE